MFWLKLEFDDWIDVQQAWGSCGLSEGMPRTDTKWREWVDYMEEIHSYKIALASYSIARQHTQKSNS